MFDRPVPFADILVLLAAAVIAVPLFKGLKLGAVLGYLAAGIVIGPSVLDLVGGTAGEREEVSRASEVGIVLLLFIIGLELRPSSLWSMRRDIFGLGTAQVVGTGAILMLGALLFGADWRTALVAGCGLALSSTAFAMQMLTERGQTALPFGRKAFAILLLQDLAIVPLLTVVALISPSGEQARPPAGQQIIAIVLALAAVVGLGRYVLNPVFTILARTNAREAMTAAGLLVVLGAAAIMDVAGLSMAMGAFLAGVMLAESNFRHTLEADLEPFRGLFLGLFFIGVGMSTDLSLVLAQWPALLGTVVAFMAAKSAMVWALVRAFGSSTQDALRVAGILPQGSEFAFVLFATATAGGALGYQTQQFLNAAVIVSMALTPLAGLLDSRVIARLDRRRGTPEAPDDFSEARASVIIVGFGRFGQIAAQMFFAEGIAVTAIDRSSHRIEEARRFGYKVYYGDATRMDVLRAAGGGRARLIAFCLEDHRMVSRAIKLAKPAFPEAAIFARAADREHAVDLIRAGVDFQVRETYESAIAFGRAALERLGIGPDRLRELEEQVRRADADALAVEARDGIRTGAERLLGRAAQAGDG